MVGSEGSRVPHADKGRLGGSKLPSKSVLAGNSCRPNLALMVSKKVPYVPTRYCNESSPGRFSTTCGVTGATPAQHPQLSMLQLHPQDFWLDFGALIGHLASGVRAHRSR